MCADRPLERTCAVHRVVAERSEEILTCVGDLQFEITVGEPMPQPLELDIDDGAQLVTSESVEYHRLIDAVEELRAEVPAHVDHDLLPQLLGCECHVEDVRRSEVGRHDDDDVAEVDGAALSVSESAVVEELQQHVEHVRVGLLHLVEEDDPVRTASHRFGELSGILVPDVARGCTDQA